MSYRSDPPDPTASAPWHGLVAVLAEMPAVVDRLLAVHVVDEPSGRCCACTRGGTGIPHTHWPCPVHGLAWAAKETILARQRRAALRARAEEDTARRDESREPGS